MTLKVGRKQTSVITTQTIQTQRTQKKEQAKETVPVGQHVEAENTAPASDTAAEAEIDGQYGGMTILSCFNCTISQTINNNVEVQGDNNGQIAAGTNAQNITTNGDNSPAAITNGDYSPTNQATGKNSQIDQQTINLSNDPEVSNEAQENQPEDAVNEQKSE